MRGAVTIGRRDQPVPDAVVKLRAGDQVLTGRTNEAGIYVAIGPAPTRATTVREVSTAVMQTGTHVPVEAQEGAGICRVVGVQVGKLQQVHAD